MSRTIDWRAIRAPLTIHSRHRDPPIGFAHPPKRDIVPRPVPVSMRVTGGLRRRGVGEFGSERDPRGKSTSGGEEIDTGRVEGHGEGLKE